MSLSPWKPQPETAPIGGGFMTCPYCGGKNAAGDQFCRTCGRTLLDGPIPFTDPEPSSAAGRRQ